MKAKELNIGDRFSIIGNAAFFEVTDKYEGTELVEYRKEDAPNKGTKRHVCSFGTRVIKYDSIPVEVEVFYKNDYTRDEVAKIIMDFAMHEAFDLTVLVSKIKQQVEEFIKTKLL